MTAFIIVVGVGVAIAILIYCVFILLGSAETKQKRISQQALLSEMGGGSLVDLYNKAQTDEEREDIVLFALQSGSYNNTQPPAAAAENIAEKESPLTGPIEEDYLEEDYLEEDTEEEINEDFDKENNEVIEENGNQGFHETAEEFVVYTGESLEAEDIEQTIVGAGKPIFPSIKEKELQIFDFASPKEAKIKEE